GRLRSFGGGKTFGELPCSMPLVSGLRMAGRMHDPPSGIAAPVALDFGHRPPATGDQHVGIAAVARLPAEMLSRRAVAPASSHGHLLSMESDERAKYHIGIGEPSWIGIPARYPELMREVLEQTDRRSYQLIWDEVKSLYANAGGASNKTGTKT